MTARAEAHEQLAQRFKALSSPERLAILRATVQPQTHDELARRLGMSRQAVAKHLRSLRGGGLLVERSGRRERSVKEYAVDAAELHLLAHDALRLVHARRRADEAYAMPTVSPAEGVRAGPTVAALASPALAVLRGGAITSCVALGGPGTRWVLGRSPQCEVVLDDKRVSLRHSVVQREPQGFLVADLESRNGTSVNGQPLGRGGRGWVRPGDVLGLGDTAVVVR